MWQEGGKEQEQAGKRIISFKYVAHFAMHQNFPFSTGAETHCHPAHGADRAPGLLQVRPAFSLPCQLLIVLEINEIEKSGRFLCRPQPENRNGQGSEKQTEPAGGTTDSAFYKTYKQNKGIDLEINLLLLGCTEAQFYLKPPILFLG
ncbi:hypothetical protein DUI87_09397 [Hirundo rustica rustica]|uniref:Uncharacterized protein n=1 Tax=Hirundo rustica rustica TaxID=333673 RepID=A0A3M0KSF9_HIRRU|nr:hypothetical protein DUI87_09397 [Hirundo rustica rustica]